MLGNVGELGRVDAVFEIAFFRPWVYAKRTGGMGIALVANGAIGKVL
jgi:hypothetical protein